MFKNIKTQEQLLVEKAQAGFEKVTREWKQQRQEAVEAIVVTFDGVEFQGDEVSQGRIARAIVALPDDTITVPWVAKDNTIVMLNKTQLSTILADAGTQQALIWNEGRP